MNSSIEVHFKEVTEVHVCAVVPSYFDIKSNSNLKRLKHEAEAES